MVMRRIGAVLFLLLMLLWAGAIGEETTVVYQDSGEKLVVSADAQEIDLGRIKVSNYDAFERFLDALPQLRRVDMYATHMFKKQAARLSERYPHIEFGWTMYIGDHRVRTYQEVFSTHHDSVKKRHTSEELEALRYCKRLKALDLGHNALTDIGFLADLPELRVLILADNRIEDLSPLAGLRHMTYIELFGNCVTDLEPLAQMPLLEDLNIAKNRVDTLEPLTRMPSLRRLWLRACGAEESLLAADALDALAAALPETLIDAKSLGTDGGWRSHPHYEVIFRMFKGTAFIPFD